MRPPEKTAHETLSMSWGNPVGPSSKHGPSVTGVNGISISADLGEQLREDVKKLEAPLCKAIEAALEPDKDYLQEDATSGSRGVSSASRLRRLQLACTVKSYLNENPTDLWEGPIKNAEDWVHKKTLYDSFENTIHRHLSYVIGESEFDAGELAFAFEGALLLQPSWMPLFQS